MIKVIKYDLERGRTELYKGETMNAAAVVYCEGWKAVPEERMKSTLIAIYDGRDKLVEMITDGKPSEILRRAMAVAI